MGGVRWVEEGRVEGFEGRDGVHVGRWEQKQQSKHIAASFLILYRRVYGEENEDKESALHKRRHARNRLCIQSERPNVCPTW